MDPGLKNLERLIKATDIRQRLIVSNIANADTPGYKSKDVKFSKLLNNEMKIAVTDPKHIGGNSSGSVSVKTGAADGLSFVDKNTVDMNEEVANMTDNAMLRDTAITILNTKIKMYRSAITRR